MDAHTASFRTGGALLFQGTLCAGLFGKVDDPTRHKRHLLFSGAPNHLSLPIERKQWLCTAFALMYWPGFALPLQVVAALPNHMAAHIGPVDMQFFSTDLLPREIIADRFGDAGFCNIGWRHPHGADQT